MEKQGDYEGLARAHFKIQYFRERWDPMEGLSRGTIFPELYRPYCVDENETPTKPGKKRSG